MTSMADPNSPQPPAGDDEIDDFFTPEEEKFAEVLEHERTQVQTADTSIASAVANDETNSPQEANISKSSSQEGENRSTDGQDEPIAEQKSSNYDQAEEQPTSLSKVPMTLHVEVARLPLSLQKLLDLKPGAVIPLGQDLEGVVDLVLEGKKVGRARLLRIGEALGLRIEQLA